MSCHNKVVSGHFTCSAGRDHALMKPNHKSASIEVRVASGKRKTAIWKAENMRSRLPIKGGWLPAGTIHWGAADTEQLCSLQQTCAPLMQAPGGDNAKATYSATSCPCNPNSNATFNTPRLCTCKVQVVTMQRPLTPAFYTLLTHCMTGKSQGITESADRRSSGKDIQNRGARTETLFETRRAVGAQGRVLLEEHRQWLGA